MNYFIEKLTDKNPEEKKFLKQVNVEGIFKYDWKYRNNRVSVPGIRKHTHTHARINQNKQNEQTIEQQELKSQIFI